MDTLRGQFGSFDDDTRDDDYGEDDIAREAPPSPVGQDERRMQVRAYNHWASMLQDRNFPSIEDLDPEGLPDFGPYSVLLDFTTGIENPAVQFLGESLAKECGTDGEIHTLEDVPSRSLLSRITDHYMQILANQAPIGFEAEFVNQRSATILYRGILLPFSSDDDTIDFIYGVINWKEMADQITTDELLLEVDQALEDDAEDEDAPVELGDEAPELAEASAADWADGPAADVLTLDQELPAEPVDEAPLPGEFEAAEAPADLPVEELAAEPEENAFASLMGTSEDGFDEDGDEEQVSEFVLPDLGDADEEDTIDQTAYASLTPLGDDGEESSIGLTGLSKKPAKKPLDLSLASALEPMEAPAEPVAYEPDVEDDLPTPAFGQEDDRFANLMGADLSDKGEVDENADDWSSPLDAVTSEPDVAEVVEPGPVELDEALVPEVAEPEVSFEDEPVVVEDNAEAIAPEPDVAPEAVEEPRTEIEMPSFEQDPSEMGLYDTLADARELAQLAQSSEERSRVALYDAVGRAYDVSLAANEAPEDFEELIAENGLTMQDRAPMTPIVKLVFGADYDKTRVTEYATVLTHAHRVGVERGELSDFLSKADGGLKGVVQAERRLRREEEGKEDVAPATEIRPALAKKLRKLEVHGFDAIDPEGPEFGVVMIRRLENGEVVLLGDFSDDVALVEKVGRKLLG